MIKNCIICGKEFQTLPYGTNRKYCFHCVPETADKNEKIKYKRVAIRNRAVALGGGKCIKCQEDRTHLLDFHHVNPNQKSNSISELLTTVSVADVFIEIQKCILLCANCHRDFHWQNTNFQIDLPTYLGFNPTPICDDGISHQEQDTSDCCQYCGKKVSKGASFCQDCRSLAQRTIERPSKEELLYLVQTFGFEEVGRRYNVSGKTISKWCKAYGMPHTIKELKNYSL